MVTGGDYIPYPTIPVCGAVPSASCTYFKRALTIYTHVHDQSRTVYAHKVRESKAKAEGRQ